jgi:hypothetical protein
MYDSIKLAALFAGITLGFAGCQSHKAKVDALQKEYDRLTQQFGKDCSAEYLEASPVLSAKCVDENKRMKDVWDRLQAERMKE